MAYGDKECRYTRCMHNDGKEMLCKKYTTMRAEMSYRKASIAWSCDFPEERFRSLIDVRKDGCWAWLGKITNKQPYFYSGTNNGLATHRAYNLEIGPIEGRLRRTCANPSCISPYHHEVLTSNTLL